MSKNNANRKRNYSIIHQLVLANQINVNIYFFYMTTIDNAELQRATICAIDSQVCNYTTGHVTLKQTWQHYKGYSLLHRCHTIGKFLNLQMKLQKRRKSNTGWWSQLSLRIATVMLVSYTTIRMSISSTEKKDINIVLGRSPSIRAVRFVLMFLY